MTGKYLMETRRKKLMEHRKKTNEKNRIKKKLISQRNLIKELRKALKDETKLRKTIEKQLKKK